MADQERTALASLWPTESGSTERVAIYQDITIGLREKPGHTKFILRGKNTDGLAASVEACTGSPLPRSQQQPTGDDPCCLNIGAEEWLITSSDRPHMDRELAAALNTIPITIFDAKSAWVVIELSGSASRDLLAQGCNQDFHPKKFQSGTFCATTIARIPAYIYRQIQADKFDLYVDRSLAMDLWLWLSTTAKEMTS